LTFDFDDRTPESLSHLMEESARMQEMEDRAGAPLARARAVRAPPPCLIGERIPTMSDPLIRPESPAEFDRIRTIYVEAFPKGREAEVVDQLRRSGRGYAGLVAEVGGEIAGHIVLTQVDLATRRGDDARGIGIAPLAVAPKFRRRGVGGALVRAAIAEAKRRNEDFVVVLGDPEYYLRFGFRKGAPTLRWRSESFDPYFMVYPIREEIVSELEAMVTYHPAIEMLDTK
jgi:putative acetyltransferase